MRRGTTPRHVFILPEGWDAGSLAVIDIAYAQDRGLVLEKHKADCVCEENQIAVNLTQEETLRFDDGPVEIQLRAKTVTGMASASQILRVDAKRILKDGEI